MGSFQFVPIEFIQQKIKKTFFHLYIVILTPKSPIGDENAICVVLLERTLSWNAAGAEWKWALLLAKVRFAGIQWRWKTIKRGAY